MSGLSSLSPPTLRTRSSSISATPFLGISTLTQRPRAGSTAALQQQQTSATTARNSSFASGSTQSGSDTMQFDLQVPTSAKKSSYNDKGDSLDRAESEVPSNTIPPHNMFSALLSLAIRQAPFRLPFSTSQSSSSSSLPSTSSNNPKPRPRFPPPRQGPPIRLSSDSDDDTYNLLPTIPQSPFTSLFISPPPLLPPPSSSPRSLSPVRLAFSSHAIKSHPILVLSSVFLLSLLPLFASLSSLPITASRSLPKTISDISNLGHELQAYATSSPVAMLHVLAVLSITAIWKHSFSIPGSVVLNCLAGVLLSPLWATLLMTLLTTVGSVLSTLLSTPLSPIVSHLFPRVILVTRSALSPAQSEAESEKQGTASPPPTPTWVRLVVMRLIGVVPWSGINVACGVCGVSLWDCAIGSFIGTLPWTAVTCQIGDILQTFSAQQTNVADPETLTSILRSPSILLKLAFLSFLSLGPILLRSKLTALLGGSSSSPSSSNGGKNGKWRRWLRVRRRTSVMSEEDGSEEEVDEKVLMSQS